MKKLSKNYKDNVAELDRVLRVDENFDILKKTLTIGKDELTLYYIDGFIKDAITTKLMLSLVSKKELGDSAREFLESGVPYVETDLTDDMELMIQMVLSGAALMIGSTFGEYAIIIDAREYPSRGTEEPQNDRVMRGPRDGFVETLIFNTALIRRRVRDTALTMHYISVGKCSKTDIVVCYLEDRADPKLVETVKTKLGNIKTDSLTMGQESLKECLVKSRWYNPFPKVRFTERPDAAAAQLFEGGVLVLCDNSPQVMSLPTTVFSFMQETNDFYFPPLTGTYIRTIRHIVFWLTLFLTPVWFLLIKNPSFIPGWLSFIIPDEVGKIPIFAQLLLVEFIIDGLRMASMNTPDMLTNSLSVVGALILGDFAVDIGWLIPEVILYMAFVAISNFTQASYELGYAFKFFRIALVILIQLFNIWGFVGGCVGILLLLATNRTVVKGRGYLYPLIPFNGKALLSLFFRTKKKSNE
ncbi:MAG: spore germination protein [Ruminococcaceae bacterium]|nr:spore germination protein [Oscillospiraceae bacterium]